VDDARSVLLRVAGELGDVEIDDASVSVVDVSEKTTWLSLAGYAPRPTAVERVAAELRERALAALSADGLLPE
jgi:hypothetical protein